MTLKIIQLLKFKDQQENLSFFADWTLLRSQFLVAENLINHAIVAPISLSVKEKTNECLSRYYANGILSNREFLQDIVYYLAAVTRIRVLLKSNNSEFIDKFSYLVNPDNTNLSEMRSLIK